MIYTSFICLHNIQTLAICFICDIHAKPKTVISLHKIRMHFCLKVSKYCHFSFCFIQFVLYFVFIQQHVWNSIADWEFSLGFRAFKTAIDDFHLKKENYIKVNFKSNQFNNIRSTKLTYKQHAINLRITF